MNKQNKQDFALVRSCMEDFRAGHHSIGRGAIILGVQGQAEIDVKLHRYVFLPGTVLFFFPSDSLCVTSATADFQVDMLLLPSDMFWEIIARIDHSFLAYCAHVRLLSVPDLDGVVWRHCFDTLTGIYAHYSVQAAYVATVLQVRSLLLCLAERVVEQPECGDGRVVAFSRTDEITKAFMQLLANHAHYQHEVLFYAENLHITPKYLNTAVRHMTGKSPKEIIDDYVLDLLKVALLTTEKNIEEIAYEYKFSSQSYMGRFFKQKMGMSPKTFRIQKQ